MQSSEQPDRVRTVRRIGMSFVVVLIVWTLIAVTLGVLRGIAEREEQSAAQDTTLVDTPSAESPEPPSN